MVRKITEENDKARLVNLVDATLAIVWTLLILEIHPPEGLENIGAYLSDELPRLASFAVCFLFLGAIWDLHQKTMNLITQIDQTIIWSNILVLLAVCFMPFTASVMTRFPGASLGAVMFACNGLLIGLMLLHLWFHAMHRNLTDADPIRIARTRRRVVLLPVMFALSIPLGFLHAIDVYLLWTGMEVGAFVYTLHTRNQAKHNVRHIAAIRLTQD